MSTVFAYICFGLLLSVDTQSSGNAEIKDADHLTSIQLEVEILKDLLHKLLLRVQRDEDELDLLKKQNHELKQTFHNTVKKMEELQFENESFTRNIEVLHNITLQHQSELYQIKSMLTESDISLSLSLTLLNNSLQELMNSPDKVSNGNDLLVGRDEMQTFKKTIKDETDKTVCKIEATMDSFMTQMSFNNTLVISDLQKMIDDAKEPITTRVTKLESSTDELLSNLTMMSSKIHKSFKDVEELKSDAELKCRSENFTCQKQFQCIPASRKCDGVADCSDKSDEEGCFDGKWGRWIEKPCSVTCGVGSRLRYRKCTNPYLQHDGKNCTGNITEHVTCLQQDPCPVHGKWSVWSENSCSVTCGVGTSLRSRNCSNPQPQYGGNNCTGNNLEHVTCTQPNKCPVDGRWSDWIEQSCSVTCGEGSRLRYRKCSNPYPQHGGKKCTGKGTDHVKCIQPIPCPVNGQWSYWRGDCSVTCGLGTILRHRECSNPRPQYGGKLCTGKSVERDKCVRGLCAIHIANNVWHIFGKLNR